MEQTTTETTTTQQEAFAEAARVSAQKETERKQAAKPPRSFTERMPCKLTDQDLLRIGKEAAAAEIEIGTLEDERKNANDGYKAKIALAEQRRSELLATIRTETEVRDVECIEEFVFATNTVRVTRVDTGAVVRQRAMSRSERQLTLDEVTAPTSEDDDSEEDEEEDDDDGSAPTVDRTAETEPPPSDGDGTAITDPDAVLDGATDNEQPKRGRRGRKSS